jgi:hypothetical protein
LVDPIQVPENGNFEVTFIQLWIKILVQMNF